MYSDKLKLLQSDNKDGLTHFGIINYDCFSWSVQNIKSKDLIFNVTEWFSAAFKSRNDAKYRISQQFPVNFQNF